MKTKSCALCSLVKDVKEFRFTKRVVNRLLVRKRGSYCKACDKEVNARSLERRVKKNPEYNRAGALWKNYRITPDDYAAMFKAQKGRCALCGLYHTKSKTSHGHSRLMVDHCHKTGKIRGLLCFSCNGLAGRVEKGAVTLEFINRIIEYLANAEYTPLPNEDREDRIRKRKAYE